MTRDEVMAMTDQGLWLQAALKAGWSNLILAEPDVLYGHRPESQTVETPRKLRRVPNYPNDIAAAWELVECVLALHKDWWADVQTNYSGERWDAGFGDYVGIELYSAAADSAPRAITRAFIMAMTANS